MTEDEKIEAINDIADSWGWSFKELMEYLNDGGTSNTITNISAMQTVHEILKSLTEDK